jgi:hypothetical protein
MKKVKTQIIFEITDIEKESEQYIDIKNSILSGDYKRDLLRNKFRAFKVERDFIPEKIKTTLISNKINTGFNQIIWTLNFTINDLAEKSEEFIEFKEMFSNGNLISELTEEHKNYKIEKYFIPKNLVVSIEIK